MAEQDGYWVSLFLQIGETVRIFNRYAGYNEPASSPVLSRKMMRRKEFEIAASC
jgi:hypothetical protein